MSPAGPLGRAGQPEPSEGRTNSTETITTGAATAKASGPGARAWRQRPFTVTHFNHVDAPLGRRVVTTWTGVVEMLGTPLAGFREKHDVPLWAPATFRGDYRNAENVLEAGALGFDDDVRPLAPDAAARLWGALGFAGVVHTTWNHGPEGPSRRVLVALSRPVTAAEYGALWQHVERRVLELGHAVGSAKDASRQWFRPALRPGGEFMFAELPGEPLDVDAVLAEAVEVEQPRRMVLDSGAGDPWGCWFAEAARVDGLVLREIGSDRIAIACPFAPEHSEAPGPRDSSTVIWAPRGSTLGFLHCSHDHCRGRSVREWQMAFSDHAIEAADRAFPSRYLRARTFWQFRQCARKGVQR